VSNILQPDDFPVINLSKQKDGEKHSTRCFSPSFTQRLNILPPEYTATTILSFNVRIAQLIKDHTLITGLSQCWTVDQSKPFHVNLHTLVPRLSTSHITLWPPKQLCLHITAASYLFEIAGRRLFRGVRSQCPSGRCCLQASLPPVILRPPKCWRLRFLQ